MIVRMEFEFSGVGRISASMDAALVTELQRPMLKASTANAVTFMDLMVIVFLLLSIALFQTI